MTRHRLSRFLAVAAASLLMPAGACAATAWQGLTDESAALQTRTFPFTGSVPAAETSNENYYDGDFGDIDGDGRPDRALNSRYGLLLNTGGGVMTPVRPQLNFFGIEYDGTQWADIDNDGDLDNFMGDNGGPLTINTNRGGRFSQRQLAGHAIIIVSTDVNGDGYVDIVATHAFCSDQPCGGAVEFRLWVNDGAGGFTEQAAARGLNLNGNGNFVTGVVSGDIDGDGDFDLLISRGSVDPTLAGVIVARNDGTGHFTMPALIRTALPASGFNQGMNLGDLDGDGDLDLVMARELAGTNPDVNHGIAINDGAGGFTDASATRFNRGAATAPLSGGNGKLVDIDYDGDLDFVAHHRASGLNTMQVFLNDGAGFLTYDAAHSFSFTGATSGLGIDVDITDLDGDGTYDVWLGLAGEHVRTMINTWRDPNGIPADQPRNLRVLSTSGGVTIAWNAPPFAATARSYKVYRSTAAGLDSRDRRVLAWVSKSRHQDECFSAPITRATTTAYLGDANVQLVGTSNEIRFTDRTAAAGVAYRYTVSHVGTENTEGAQAPEVAATVAAAGGPDTVAPELEIVAPTVDAWSAYPRVVLLYGDGGSGADPATLRVSFSRPLGSLTAGSDVSGQFERKDGGCYVSALRSPLQLPTGSSLVTMTATIADRAGNVATKVVTFSVTGTTTLPPVASFTLAPATGTGPLTVDVDASASSDTAPGKVVRWEWSFGDGATATGRAARHVYAAAGTYTARLVVRDNSGALATSTRTVIVTAPGTTTGTTTGTSGTTGGTGTTGSASTTGTSGTTGGAASTGTSSATGGAATTTGAASTGGGTSDAGGSSTTRCGVGAGLAALAAMGSLAVGSRRRRRGA
jgi:PKD repeat protein